MSTYVAPRDAEWRKIAHAGAFPSEIVEPLKQRARQEGLWNLFLPSSRDDQPRTRLSKLEYAAGAAPCFTSSPATSSEAAYRMRLVQEVVKPGAQLDRAIAIADRIAAQAPLADAATLTNARTMILEGHPTAAAGLGRVQARLLETEDAAEGLLSFRERRLAAFEGR